MATGWRNGRGTLPAAMSAVERRRREAGGDSGQPGHLEPARSLDDAALFGAWSDLVASHPDGWVAVRDGRVVAVADDQLALFDCLGELRVPVIGTMVEKLSARPAVGVTGVRTT